MGTVVTQAQEAAPAIDSGNTAWILTSTALVLFMAMPGLALFYGGLVRGRNVLSVMAQCAGIACMASLLWVAGLYSLAFKGDGAWIGNLDAAFLKGIHTETVAPGTTLPETLFVMFQMTFAIITPGLYVGAVVERMKFGSIMLFSALWLAVVYAPVTHWVWGGGWLQDMGVKDLAGGGAGMTMLVTHLSACAAALVWCLLERIRNGKVGLIGMVTGLVAGLATITPASGDVGPLGAIVIGSIAAVVCYFAVSLIREKWHIDDSLDVFAVHGVGGILGTLLLAIFGQSALGGLGNVKSMGTQLGIQATGLGVTILWSAVATVGIAWLVKITLGLRVSEEQEYEGVDRSEHGENAYPMEP